MKTFKVYRKTAFGREMVALVHADRAESEPQFPHDPYCSTFRTRFMGTGLLEWTTIWSDSLSWETETA
jgi:hypothetical protein